MMLYFLIFQLLSLSLSPTRADPSAGVIYAAAPETRGQFHVGGRNTYNYGYNTGDGIAKVEVRHQDGSVTGSYRYYDPLGRQIVRSYTADKRGFRVLGNDLPSNPDSPALGILDSQTLTGGVEGTKEFTTLSLTNPPNNDIVFTNNQNIGTYQNQVNQKVSNVVEDSLDQTILQKQQELANLVAQRKYKNKVNKQNLNGFSHNMDGRSFLQNFSSQKEASGGNYFFSDDNIHYDFPAGFAYNVLPVIDPIGVKGREVDNLVTAGHTVRGRSHSSVGPYREYKPVRSQSYRPLKVRHNRNYRTNTRPYVIGHFK